MAADILSQERLRELLSYDPETGIFTWRVDRGANRCAGKVAGGLNEDGYVIIEINGRSYGAHRLAWLYMKGCWPAQLIDHEDGIRARNVFSNLRDSNRRHNGENQRKAHTGKKSGKLLGTYRRKPHHRWCAMIRVHGVLRRLGMFDTEQEAHNAYVEAKRELHEGCTI